LKRLIAAVVAPVALVMSLVIPAPGMQSAGGTRSVEGKVTNPSGKIVAGAVVQIKDLKSLQIRSFITQSDGVYRFLELSTESDYELSASYAGTSSKVKTLSVFDSRKKAVVDLKLR
jgi:Carboxypeptidase regulatory-like domain